MAVIRGQPPSKPGAPRVSKPASKPMPKAVKAVVGLLLLAVLGFLFMRSVRGTRAEPYTIARDDMRPWHLGVQAGGQSGDAVLILQPPPALVGGLFGQLFKRAMESMSTPATAGIPLLLQGELTRAQGGHPALTPEAILAIAREVGLEGAPPQPRCLAHRRANAAAGSGPGSALLSDRQQMYFVLFDLPAFAVFRQRMAALINQGASSAADDPGAGFDPLALSPALLLALVESTADRWLPLRADPAVDCVAPIVVSAAPPG